MMNKQDRCSRIAELLLIENEVNKLERASTIIDLDDTVHSEFDYYDANNIKITPIEKIMYAILKRVVENYEFSYGNRALEFYFQQPVGQYRVDFLVTAEFSDDKIVIECDGHEFHEKTKEQAKHDKERDRYLTAQGFKILRYTGSEIYNDFDKIEKELTVLLDVPFGQSLFREKRNGSSTK